MNAQTWFVSGAATLSIASMLFGCSSSGSSVGAPVGEDGGPPVVLGPPVVQGDFCREYTLALCAAEAQCCGGAGASDGGRFDDANCIANARKACDFDLTMHAQKKADFNAVAAGNCVMAMKTAPTCARIGKDPSIDCPEVFVGTASEGERCDQGMCRPELYCPQVAALGCMNCPPPPPPTCQRRGAAGGKCEGTDDSCLDGLVCLNGVCVAKVGIGAACESYSNDCFDGLFCDSISHTCAPAREVGDLCSDTRGCKSMNCLKGVCVPADRGLPYCP